MHRLEGRTHPEVPAHTPVPESWPLSSEAHHSQHSDSLNGSCLAGLGVPGSGSFNFSTQWDASAGVWRQDSYPRPLLQQRCPCRKWVGVPCLLVSARHAVVIVTAQLPFLCLCVHGVSPGKKWARVFYPPSWTPGPIWAFSPLVWRPSALWTWLWICPESRWGGVWVWSAGCLPVMLCRRGCRRVQKRCWNSTIKTVILLFIHSSPHKT